MRDEPKTAPVEPSTEYRRHRSRLYEPVLRGEKD
jgi:hypothetical protein